MKIAILFAAASALACAQPPVPAQTPPPPAQAPAAYAPPPPLPAQPSLKYNRVQPAAAPVPRPAVGRALGPSGRWWSNPETAQRIGLTADQQKRMDDIFQQHRLQLVDLDAALQKAEIIMEPLVSADQPDEARILAQIDKVAQARAELEKANARMLLDIRRVLTADQWKKLQAEAPPPGQLHKYLQGIGQGQGRGVGKGIGPGPGR